MNCHCKYTNNNICHCKYCVLCSNKIRETKVERICYQLGILVDLELDIRENKSVVLLLKLVQIVMRTKNHNARIMWPF